MSSMSQIEWLSAAPNATLAPSIDRTGGVASIEPVQPVSRFENTVRQVPPLGRSSQATHGHERAGDPAPVASVVMLPVARSASRTTEFETSPCVTPPLTAWPQTAMPWLAHTKLSGLGTALPSTVVARATSFTRPSVSE